MMCLVDVLKYNFGEVDEAMFQSVVKSSYLIFYTLGMEKSYLDEVA
jgi:hypothetical protein